jgi:hypothetical protein
VADLKRSAKKMIRRHWLDSAPERWTTDQRKYASYLKKTDHCFPARLRRFVREFTLHDDRISHIEVVERVPSGRDALITLKLFRDGVHGIAALAVLHLIGVRGPVKRAAPDLDIIFFDVEQMKGSTFQLSFALEEKKTWSVKFRDFDFYLHDYRKKAPNQSLQPTALLGRG